nr:ribosomal protein S11 [Cylindrocapsa geminella]
MGRRARQLANNKQKKKKVFRGKVHIRVGYQNTLITITNVRGDTVCWSSSGSCGFKGKRKATTFAAKTAAETAARKARDLFLKDAKILVKGPGLGRESAIRAFLKSKIRINIIRDKTGIPHNGCRPPKKRRV